MLLLPRSCGNVPLGDARGGSAAVLAGNERYAARQRAARRWLIDSGSGFGLVGGPSVSEVGDYEVTNVCAAQAFAAARPPGQLREPATALQFGQPLLGGRSA